MTRAPEVTVVIPTHNRQHLLMRTLRSVVRQRDVALQVVVVDDGGSDGSADLVRRLRIDEVRLVRHETNRGVSAARNTGLKTADAPWTAFIDDDDLWAPNKLREQLELLRRRPQARWSCVGAFNVDPMLRVVSVTTPPDPADVAQQLLRRNAIPGGGSGVLVATELAHELGGFDAAMSIVADWDFYLRLSRRAEMSGVSRPLMAYVMHPDSMVNDALRLMEELLYLERKHLARGVPFQLDRAYWFTSLVRIAQKQGNWADCRRLAMDSATEASLTSIAREVLRRSWARLAPRRAEPRKASTGEEEWLRLYEEDDSSLS